MTTGEYVFGDVESNAVVRIKFHTMPVRGDSRYNVGEPFYFFDMKAELNHNGVFEEIIMVDRKKTLEKIDPIYFVFSTQ